ncbi:MAG: OmpA family protein [Deltaproteobacteria bacterium]|nr:OmpA family protein [Deltaproteobacteria bacterium]
MNRILAVALLAAFGCATAKPAEEKKETQTKVEQPDDSKQKATQAAEFKAKGQAELDKALVDLKSVTVFFNFDDSTLTKDAQDKLAVIGDILTRHPELDVKIEGNADERGTAQYNLALGQRRADQVKAYLAKFGAKAEQIKAISFGAEKPVDPGHTEEAYAKNRRADVAAGPEAKKDAGATEPKK